MSRLVVVPNKRQPLEIRVLDTTGPAAPVLLPGEIEYGDVFQFSWREQAYLKDYYPEEEVPSDEVATNAFFVNRLRGITTPVDIAVLGTGPTCDDIILVASKAKTIYAYDYVPRNLDIVQDWIKRGSASRNWNEYTRDILQHEDNPHPSQSHIDFRERIARSKTRLGKFDLRQKDPLGEELRGSFAVVVMPYCADSATNDKEEWQQMMHNASALVAPRGLFLVGALEECEYYPVGGIPMPAANLTEDDMRQQLALDFDPNFVHTESKSLPKHEELGYKGILLAWAIKSA